MESEVLEEVHLAEVVEGSLTVVAAAIPFEDTLLLSVGTARCHPKDTFDEAIGEELAVGRALTSLGEQMTKHAIELSNEACASVAIEEIVETDYRNALDDYHEALDAWEVELLAATEPEYLWEE